MTTAIVVKGYPRLSETFIAQEIKGLEERGLDALIVSLRHPTDRARHPIHEQIKAPLLYLPEYLWQEPLRLFRAWRVVRRRPEFGKLLKIWWRDFRRDMTPNRVRRLGQAFVLAAELPSTVDRLYAHFLHTPSSVTRYAALLSGLPWSASAHAVDIWTTPDWELREKIADAEWVVTCTRHNEDYLAALDAEGGKVALVYHGLDLERFDAGPEHDPESISPGATPVCILSVGRAVPKKGYPDLLDALAQLPPDQNWRMVHIGGGPDIKQLKKRAARLGISNRIEWTGSQSHEYVLERYRAADIFALACKIAPNGDRDGLPNVLMEAQSQSLPVISTDVSAVSELILDGQTGLLSAPGDIGALSSNLAKLIGDPVLRRRLGTLGRENVRKKFAADTCLNDLAIRFGLQSPTQTSRVA